MPVRSSPDVVVESEQRVWSGRCPLDVIQFRQRRFDGTMSSARRWEVWRRGQAVAMVPYDPVADALVLIEQFRFPAYVAGFEPTMVELPAGFIDAGETPEAAMGRELHEEMGLSGDRLTPIGTFMLSPGGADESCVLFAGRVTAPPAGPDGIAGIAGEAAEHEDIRTRVWPADAAIAAALKGEFTNAITMIGLLWFAANRDRLRREWSQQ